MKLIQILILLLFVSCANDADNSSNFSKLGLDTSSHIYTVSSEDSSMNLAILKAKQTLNIFDKALISENSSYTKFAVKKRYETPDNDGEHMWIAVLQLTNGNYTGFVNNDAEKTKEVKYGDTVVVQRNEVTDWMYLDKNVLRGGYTIREVRNHLTKNERAKMDHEMGFKVED